MKIKLKNHYDAESLISDFNTFSRALDDALRVGYPDAVRHVKRMAYQLSNSELGRLSDEIVDDFDVKDFIQRGVDSVGGMAGSAKLPWPNNEIDEIGAMIAIARHLGNENVDVINFAFNFFYDGNNHNNNLQSLLNRLYVGLNQKIELIIKGLIPDEKISEATQIERNAKDVFIVHGHNPELKESVARYVEKIKLNAIILHEKANEGLTIIEKFEKHSDVGFAIILLTGDDVGGLSSGQLQKRARQNVVFELGYFSGKLGRSRVCAIREGDVEIPSDMSGVIYLPWNENWKANLAKELIQAGMDVDLAAVLS